MSPEGEMLQKVEPRSVDKPRSAPCTHPCAHVCKEAPLTSQRVWLSSSEQLGWPSNMRNWGQSLLPNTLTCELNERGLASHHPQALELSALVVAFGPEAQQKQRGHWWQTLLPSSHVF